MTTHKPDVRVAWTWSICALCAAVLPFLAAVWLWRWPVIPDWVGGAFALLCGGALLLTLTVYIPLRKRRIRYALTPDHLILWSGVLCKSEHYMPRNSVRHVTLLRGPLEYRFGTAFLLVNGAGGFLLLEGMPLELAEDWRHRLLEVS